MNKLMERYRNAPKQVKASVWFLVCSVLQKGISVITTPIFTRLLTTEEYGQYSVFNSWLSIVTIIITFNLSYGVYTQGLVKFGNDRRVYSSSMQGLSTTLVASGTVVYLLFHNFWNNLFTLTTVQMLAMLVMIWTTAVFRFWAAEQRVELKYQRLVLITLIVSAAKPLLSVLFVVRAEDKVTARILGLMLAELIGYVGLYYVQMKRGKKFFSAKYWKHALRFNLPLIPHYLSQTVLQSADRIMIADMIGSSEAGIYGLAYSLSQIMRLFNTALLQTMSPWMYQKIQDGKSQDIHRIAYGAMAVIAGLNILLMALAPEAVAIFAPSSYYAAIWVIPPVSMSVFFIFLYDMFSKFEFYYEKTKFIMTASIIGAVANIVLNFIFIPMFGFVAAGYTTLVCYVIYAFGHYIFMNRVCKQYMNGERPFSAKIILLITLVFMAIGFYFLFTYNFRILRYASLGVMILILILARKPIMRMLRSIMSTRSKKTE